MKLQQRFGHRSAQASVARRRSRRPHVERLEGRAVPASYTVANAADLITAISAANATAEADTITLAARKTFTLVYIFPGNDDDTGLPAIAAGEDLTVVGNGAVIERSTNNGGFRFFNVAAGGSLTLQDLTLQGGLCTQRRGGALFNRGALTLDRVVVQNNRVVDSLAVGGGVYSEGNLIIKGSTIRGNSAVGARGYDGSYYCFGTWFVSPGGVGGSAYGGGVYLGGGSVSISNSAITANTARGGDGGAGVDAKPDGVVLRSAGGDGGNGFGGGLYAASGTITLRNSDIAQNGAIGGSGGQATRDAAPGQPGQGVGGAVYIVVAPTTGGPLASVSLDAFTVNHTKGNKASTTDNNIHGPYTPIP
jgi:hypothetical protein